MLSSKGLSVVLGAANDLNYSLVGPYTSLFACRKGRKRRWGWRRMERRVTGRETSFCLLDSYSRNGLCLCLPDGTGKGLGEAITGATEGLPAWTHPEAVWQRDSPIRGRLDIHTAMSMWCLLSTPKSSFWQTRPLECKYLCDCGSILIVTCATVSTTPHVEQSLFTRGTVSMILRV